MTSAAKRLILAALLGVLVSCSPDPKEPDPPHNNPGPTSPTTTPSPAPAPAPAPATCSSSCSSSGACSGHGGVNCSAGPDSDGSVICSDGWRGSSVAYHCN